MSSPQQNQKSSINGHSKTHHHGYSSSLLAPTVTHHPNLHQFSAQDFIHSISHSNISLPRAHSPQNIPILPTYSGYKQSNTSSPPVSVYDAYFPLPRNNSVVLPPERPINKLPEDPQFGAKSNNQDSEFQYSSSTPNSPVYHGRRPSHPGLSKTPSQSSSGAFVSLPNSTSASASSTPVSTNHLVAPTSAKFFQKPGIISQSLSPRNMHSFVAPSSQPLTTVSLRGSLMLENQISEKIFGTNSNTHCVISTQTQSHGQYSPYAETNSARVPQSPIQRAINPDPQQLHPIDQPSSSRRSPGFSSNNSQTFVSSMRRNMSFELGRVSDHHFEEYFPYVSNPIGQSSGVGKVSGTSSSPFHFQPYHHYHQQSASQTPPIQQAYASNPGSPIVNDSSSHLTSLSIQKHITTTNSFSSSNSGPQASSWSFNKEFRSKSMGRRKNHIRSSLDMRQRQSGTTNPTKSKSSSRRNRSNASKITSDSVDFEESAEQKPKKVSTPPSPNGGIHDVPAPSPTSKTQTTTTTLTTTIMSSSLSSMGSIGSLPLFSDHPICPEPQTADSAQPIDVFGLLSMSPVPDE